jgi:protein SHQ1
VSEVEENVEGAWNVSRLSSTLCWFEKFNSLKNAVTHCYRRMLTLPRFRNWDLNELVKSDVQLVLGSGKKAVVKCLLEILTAFNKSEPYYLLNRFYVQDYCVFVQKVDESRFQSLSRALARVNVSKNDVGLGLIECDLACELVKKEMEGGGGGDVKGEDGDSDDLSSDSDDDDDEESSESVSGESYVVNVNHEADHSSRHKLETLSE